jgi:hypothetical protein
MRYKSLLWAAGVVILSSTIRADDNKKVQKPDRAGFYNLFNGKDIDDWKVSDTPSTFKVENGELVVHGPRAHLYYMGPIQNHEFKNFHLVAEVMTFPKANSGIYFHTRYQETGWPDYGFECQVNNSHTDRKRTGGLYDIKDVMDEAPARDYVWFKYEVIVRDKKVTLKVDGKTTCEWTQPEGFVPPEGHAHRVIDTGTIALQGHDPGSETHYKSIKIKPLK